MVKGTMLRAHLDWAQRRFGEGATEIASGLSPEAARLLSRTVLSTDWIPFKLLVEIDRAIASAAISAFGAVPAVAAAAGPARAAGSGAAEGSPAPDGPAAPPTEDEIFRGLGRHSASLNLGGVYRSFVSSEPHRFFERTSVLHHQFQNFGRSTYERTGERSGRIRIEGYTSYSPVFCSAGAAYFEEALRLMHVPGRPEVVESSCHCRGDSACVFEARW